MYPIDFQSWIQSTKTAIKKNVKKIKFWERSKPALAVIPAFNSTSSLPDYQSGHWKGLEGEFVLVGENKIQLLDSPSPTGNTLRQLRLSERVRIVYEKKPWVFLVSENGKEYLGWMDISGLAFKHHFTPVTEWFFERISFCKGEYCAEYKSNRSGYFEGIWKSKGSGLHLSGKMKGRFYAYQNLIWAKRDPEDLFEDFFYIDSKERIKHEWKYHQLPLITD